MDADTQPIHLSERLPPGFEWRPQEPGSDRGNLCSTNEPRGRYLRPGLTFEAACRLAWDIVTPALAEVRGDSWKDKALQ